MNLLLFRCKFPNPNKIVIYILTSRRRILLNDSYPSLLQSILQLLSSCASRMVIIEMNIHQRGISE